MIDLHCHLLPGIDDGPADTEGAVELGRRLAANGVQTVAATPHLRDDHPGVVPEELAGRCAAMRKSLAEAGVDLAVIEGGEADVVWALEASAEELRLTSFYQRGTDLLLETPYGPLTSTFEKALFRIAGQGYRLLLAHPERNPTFQEDPARLADLVRRGTYVQLTASSLLRPPRQSRSGRLARSLLKDGLAHVLASDSHGSAVRREPLSEGLEIARRLVGPRADWMVEDAPAAIVAGEPLPPPPPQERRRRRVFAKRRSGLDPS